MNNKSSIRKEKLALRLAMGEEQRREFSALVVERLKSAVKLISGTVALYYPVRGEVDVTPFMEYENICLPVVISHSKQMLFRKIEGMLKKNSHGVMQPQESAELCQPDVIITPLVAFDRRGHRIGYGAGYYDTTLAALRAQRKIMAIGAAFSFQEVEKVPEEGFDATLDKIITEKEII